MNVSRRQFTIASGAAALAGMGFPALVRAQPNKIVFGQSAPLSGDASELGIHLRNGIKLHFDQINKAGGIAGQMIELKSVDDGYNPALTAENTRKFIADDVFGLLAYAGTAPSLAAMPLALSANLPFIAPATGAVELRNQFHKNVFHFRASYQDETAAIVKYVHGLGQKTIGIFHQADSFGNSGRDGVLAAMKEMGMKAPVVASVERNSTDVAQAVKTLAAAAPQVVILISVYKSSAAFIREAKAAGYGGNFYSTSGGGAQTLVNELPKHRAGLVIAQTMPAPTNGTREIVRGFMNAVKESAAAGIAVKSNYSSLEGYVYARVVAEGLKRAVPRLTRESFVAGLESIGRQSLGGYQLTLGSTVHTASNFVELSMVTADGNFLV